MTRRASKTEWRSPYSVCAASDTLGTAISVLSLPARVCVCVRARACVCLLPSDALTFTHLLSCIIACVQRTKSQAIVGTLIVCIVWGSITWIVGIRASQPEPRTWKSPWKSQQVLLREHPPPSTRCDKVQRGRRKRILKY